MGEYKEMSALRIASNRLRTKPYKPSRIDNFPLRRNAERLER